MRRGAFAVHHDLFCRDGMGRARRLLDRSQWWRKEELAAYQQKKLAALLSHACTHVPYYERIWRDLGLSSGELESPSLLRKFPILDKVVIRQNCRDLHVREIEQYEVKENSTSGSTGESLFFLVDLSHSVWSGAAGFRGYEWCRVSPFEREATLWGARFDAPPRKSLVDRLRLWTRPLLFLSSYDLSQQTMAKYVQELVAYGPRLLTSYPSPLEVFAEFCIARGIGIPSLRAIICSAEQLFPGQREIMEKAFGVPVFNRYGCREFGSVAQECDRHSGLHLAAERVYVEILDANGNPCRPGEIGELVITDLDNYVMPFIRYRIGDLARWSERQCPCGRGLPLLEGIEGRVFDLIKTKAGDVISGTFWTLLLRHVSEDIRAFQVRQDNLEEVRILLQMRSGGELPPESRRELLARIAERAPGLLATIEYVDHIPLTRSGKRRFVISKVKQHSSVQR